MPRYVDVNRDDPWAKELAEQREQEAQTIDAAGLTFHEFNQDDPFGRQNAEPGPPPLQTPASEGGLQFDEFDPKNVYWEEHGLKLANHTLDPSILIPEEPVYVEPHYSFQEQLQNGYRMPRDYRYEAYRWPADGEEQRLHYIEDVKAEAAARKAEQDAAERHNPFDDPDPKPAPYLQNPEFTVEIHSERNRTAWVEYLPPEPTEGAKRATSRAQFDAEMERINQGYTLQHQPLQELDMPEGYVDPREYANERAATHQAGQEAAARHDPSEDPDPPYYGNPHVYERSDFADSYPNLDLQPNDTQRGEYLVFYGEEQPTEPVAWNNPFAPMEAEASSADPVAEVQEVFPGAEEVTEAGGWNLLSDWGTPVEAESQGEEGQEGDEGEDNGGGGDGFVWQ